MSGSPVSRWIDPFSRIKPELLFEVTFMENNAEIIGYKRNSKGHIGGSPKNCTYTSKGT